jgi:hypothetical protein
MYFPLGTVTPDETDLRLVLSDRIDLSKNHKIVCNLLIQHAYYMQHPIYIDTKDKLKILTDPFVS